MISAGLPGDTLFGEMVISANGLSLLGGGWGIRLHRGNDGYADVIATLMSDDVIRIKTRVKYQGAWMPWRELANDYSIVNALEKKAPSGFGLGSNAKSLTADDDLNNVLTTGWYQWGWNAHPKNAPDNHWGLYGCTMHVFSTVPGGYAIQTVYDMSDDITHGCAIQRTVYWLSSGSVFYPWEWVNPPMQTGAEYRTTQRFWGKPVYYKIVDCGKIADNKQVEHGVANMRDCIFCQGLRGAIPMPSISNNDLSDPWSYYVADVDRTKITLACGTTAAGGNCHVILKYTKTTD